MPTAQPPTGQPDFGQHALETLNLDRVKTDYANRIDYDDRTRWPLAAWISRSGNSVQKDTDMFVLFQGQFIPRQTTASDSILQGTATGTLTVGSSAGMVVNTILHCPNATGATGGDLMIVTAVNSATSIDVRRITDTAVITGTLVTVGNTDQENSTTGPAAYDIEPGNVLGYMTILKRRIDISITERNNAVRGAADRLAEKLDRAKDDFLLDREHNCWFSQAVSDATNKLRFSMGIYPQIANDASAVKTDAGAVRLLDETIGDTIAKSARWNRTSNFHLFHGQSGMGDIWRLQMLKYETRTGESKYGMHATTVSGPGGVDLSLVYTRIFDIIGAPYDAVCVGLDMSSVSGVHLKGGMPQLKRNVHPDKSGEYESHIWRAQEGIQITWPKRHFLIHNIAALT